jgi:hypothetical protein
MGKAITPFIRRHKLGLQSQEEKKKIGEKVSILNPRFHLGIIRKPFFERFDKI